MYRFHRTDYELDFEEAAREHLGNVATEHDIDLEKYRIELKGLARLTYDRKDLNLIVEILGTWPGHIGPHHHSSKHPDALRASAGRSLPIESDHAHMAYEIEDAAAKLVDQALERVVDLLRPGNRQRAALEIAQETIKAIAEKDTGTSERWLREEDPDAAALLLRLEAAVDVMRRAKRQES